MITAIESGTDFILTFLLVIAVISGSVVTAVMLARSHPLWHRVSGGAALAIAPLILVGSVGSILEIRRAIGPEAVGYLGAQWPSWIAAGVLAISGILLLWPRRERVARPAKVETLGLHSAEKRTVALVVLFVVAAAIMSLVLPVWDCHMGWSGNHCHTYISRGFHAH